MKWIKRLNYFVVLITLNIKVNINNTFIKRIINEIIKIPKKGFIWNISINDPTNDLLINPKYSKSLTGVWLDAHLH